MSDHVTNIFVYAHWNTEPQSIGVLSFHQSGGRQYFDFEYDKNWLHSRERLFLDPEIQWYSGKQFSSSGNFGIFTDSMPDTWGRTLMRRRSAILAKDQGKAAPKLGELEYLLGVYDPTRMGALRFKLDPQGPFLDNTHQYPTPQWAQLRELEEGIRILESDSSDEEIRNWLKILLAPGSSLGGARPKSNVLDTDNQLWIAKFPSKEDTVDKGAWEYLTYQLAIQAGIKMSSSKILNCGSNHHTFLTRRFDRDGNTRIHFVSAMTMTEHNEAELRLNEASYLELVECIENHSSNPSQDLEELWRRIVFNICTSNTDDHLRNHGFILDRGGWRLSPAYDINPSVDKAGLSLNIDLHSNELDIELARSVSEFFRLSSKKSFEIIDDVQSSVRQWRSVACNIGISRKECEELAPAFHI